jgi:hypothetical protein
MSVVESVEFKRDKRSKTHHGSPREPERVRDIISGRDKLRKTWQALGDEFGITRAGARHLYHRWHDWFKEDQQASASAGN